MEITAQQLVAVTIYCGKHAPDYVGPINEALVKAQINTPIRVASFIAQLLHESECFAFSKELASGEEYEGRKDLGNTQPGDGVKFKGRGPIEVTGRYNYGLCSHYLFGDDRLLEHPELLEQPEYGTLAAGWFWQAHGCNELADANNQRALCRRIDGGFNGLTDRLALFAKARLVFGVKP